MYLVSSLAFNEHGSYRFFLLTYKSARVPVMLVSSVVCPLGVM